MIREGKKLPADILVKIPAAVAKIAEDKSVIALYTFGSLAESNLRPLSDVDFAVLLSESLDRQERFGNLEHGISRNHKTKTRLHLSPVIDPKELSVTLHTASSTGTGT